MEPANLTFQLLKEITDGFSDDRLLGAGSYGKVYKGIHTNGDVVAVKMFLNADEKFQELYNHMGLNHPNIVRVVGYCNEAQLQFVQHNGRYIVAEVRQRALCLEYLENGSLQNHLSDECDGLDWQARFKIIKGIAEGLHYLHNGYKVPIYHLDLKPDNILLDMNMEAKLADFGESPFGRVQTRRIRDPVGTLGYMPPEYIDACEISARTDVYSMGVVMIKIIAGPGSRSNSVRMSPEEFIDLVQRNWRKRLQATWSGSRLEAYCQQVKSCTQIALNCAVLDAHKRPEIASIRQSVAELEMLTAELKNDEESLEG